MAAAKPQDSAKRVTKTVEQAAGKAKATLQDVHGPSPNIATNLAIADIALRAGSVVARQAVERTFLGQRYSSRKAAKILKGRSLGETLLHGALARVALGSVPGAIIVGGALVAKTLYDRSRARQSHHEGEAALEEQAKDAE